jgi:hypothetical protein
MSQTEIDEISEAFKEAWEDYFGDVLYYVPFDYASTQFSEIYGESKKKKYLFLEKKPFHGTIKERELLDVNRPTGRSREKEYELTFVTKELIDQGITEVDTNSIIIYTDRFEKEYRLIIFDDYQKVQLVDNKVFTKLKVKYYE